VSGGRRTVLIGTAIAGLIALSALAVWKLRPAPRPNVLLITLDTTRADRIGCYGHKTARTTAIDALAAGGVAFDNAYVTVPLTLPSHASMLTGLYPPENGLADNGAGRLADSVPTLAELLQQHSYRTGAFIGSIVLHAQSGLDRGFDLYDDDMVGGERHGDESHLMRNARLVVDSALHWLNSLNEGPFFCWLHFFDPHAPYQPHEEIFGDRFADNPYDGDIAFTDVHIDRLLQRLKDTGQYDNTLIIVVGDHGEGFGDHEELEHGFLLYNSTVRVPLIIRDPRSAAAAGTRVATPVSLVDLMPTVLDCLEIPSTAHTSGLSMKPALQRQGITSRPCYSQTTAAFSAFGWAPLKSIATDDWKYIQTTRDELYDLRHDPGETNNLADTNAEQKQRMQQLLGDVEAQMAVVEVAETEVSDVQRRALEAFGYVGGGNAPPAATDQPLRDVKDMIRFYNADMSARKLMSSGQLDAAIAQLQQTIAEAPDFLRAQLTLAAAYQMQDRLDEAAAVYTEALRIAPDSHDAHFDYATLQAGRGEKESAIEHFRAAIKARPSAATAHVNLATLLYSTGDIAGARESFEAGLKAFPDSTAGQFNYGVFLAEQGELDAGVQHVERAAALNPRNAQIQFRLGELLLEQRRFGAAAERFAETLRLNPRYPKAAEQLAEAERQASGAP